MTPERAFRIHEFLTDTLLEPGWWPWVPRPVRRWYTHAHYQLVELPLRWVWCPLFGHAPTTDHCGLPEHDLCMWCGLDMPGQAPRRVAR